MVEIETPKSEFEEGEQPNKLEELKAKKEKEREDNFLRQHKHCIRCNLPYNNPDIADGICDVCKGKSEEQRKNMRF